MTERSGEARRNTGAERTNARVPAFVPEGGVWLPPWVFDGEALADRVRRLKFERSREIADLFHEVRTAGGTVAKTVRTGGGVTHAARDEVEPGEWRVLGQAVAAE
jgi:hypothetical protein